MTIPVPLAPWLLPVALLELALLANPQPHIGNIYHLTGPQSENMHFFAQEYSKALGHTIVYQDIPVGPWRSSCSRGAGRFTW